MLFHGHFLWYNVFYMQKTFGICAYPRYPEGICTIIDGVGARRKREKFGSRLPNRSVIGTSDVP